MLKKLIFFISFSSLMFCNLNVINANESNLIPLKKPTLTEQELKKKVLINILKPLPKPIELNKKVIKKEETKPKF